mmetsp:Transcript_55740/g.126653  ORF Transcript_55740/g.126653 Transcript_55740/m.126653 type:complete len:206 (+) Transcript_55740:57-674(+)|eukprot:CAMPEP_0172646444 /NCGR_PEP_ID=MMETSP1068-20121228/240241_1 /TAXON_ID=35684 /ORGANISM="Pseudopedinella elastica, Strain CCMP716" /LENGTH=205 /DNA_ID=CAMNT_0013460705 /DNA_START=443 /DNA_END=1060 /DNA_ORIENTATION=+
MQALLFVLALLPFSQGFAPAAPARWTRTSVAASAESASRREVMSGLGLALVAGLSGASPARAGYLNADTLPEVLKPDASMVDRDVLKTAKVQDAIKEVNFYLEVVKEMEKSLAANTQLDLAPGIIKYLPFDKIRTAFNSVNEALDEDTQRGTDRLVRNIIQDITELESANKLKAGIVRSERKIGIMKGKLEKLDCAITDFLKFFE